MLQNIFQGSIASFTTEMHPPLSWKQQEHRAGDEEYIIQLKLQRNFK